VTIAPIITYESLPAGWSGLSATPYEWVGADEIPPREWLYGRHLIRQFVSLTVAPGGIGKSSLLIADALAMTSGRNLVGSPVRAPSPLRVWLWNLEDPFRELQRRVAATAKHYDIGPNDISDSDGSSRLFVDSGRDQACVIAETTKAGATIVRPMVDALLATLKRNRIDVLIVDPFVSSHRVTENDNDAIDLVAKEWGRIAGQADCAVELVHHTRKGAGNDVETSTDSARGAKALTDAARSVRVINRMTQDEAAKAGIDGELRRRYFRVYVDKNNLSPPAEKSDWFKLESVDLDNAYAAPSVTLDEATNTLIHPGEGDSVGVVTQWQWPDPFQDVKVADLLAVQRAIDSGDWKESPLAKPWAGEAVAQVLGFDISEPSGKARAKALLKVWIENGMLQIVRRPDESRRERSFVEVGQWASAGQSAPV
jgi:hypothetical protein